MILGFHRQSDNDQKQKDTRINITRHEFPTCDDGNNTSKRRNQALSVFNLMVYILVKTGR